MNSLYKFIIIIEDREVSCVLSNISRGIIEYREASDVIEDDVCPGWRVFKVTRKDSSLLKVGYPNRQRQ